MVNSLNVVEEPAAPFFRCNENLQANTWVVPILGHVL